MQLCKLDRKIHELYVFIYLFIYTRRYTSESKNDIGTFVQASVYGYSNKQGIHHYTKSYNTGLHFTSFIGL